MNIYFDTEFTGLYQNTKLLSIGMVDESGEKLFYGELPIPDMEFNNWMKENVLAHLACNDFAFRKYLMDHSEITYCDAESNEELALAMSIWFKQFNEVQLVSDVCHYDMVLFINTFGGAFDLPGYINPACHDINQDIANHLHISERDAFNYSRENFVTRVFGKEASRLVPGYKHNALYDAQIIRLIYKATMSNGSVHYN